MNNNQNSNATTKNETIDDEKSGEINYQQEHSIKTNIWQRFLRKKLDEQPRRTSHLRNLFRYATITDIFYMILATLASAIFAISNLLDLVVLGNAIDSFTDRSSTLCSLNFTSLTEQYCPPGIILTSIIFYASILSCNMTGLNFTNINYNLADRTRIQIIYTVIIGFIGLISGYIRVTFFNISAERQTRTIRRKLFKSILMKDIVYFDNHKIGELNSLLIDDVEKIGDKLGLIVNLISIFISSIIIDKLLFYLSSYQPVSISTRKTPLETNFISRKL